MTSPPAPVYLGPAAHTSKGENKPIHRIVIHGTVSACKPGGARQVAKYFRSQAAGGSAQYVVDPGEVVQVVYDSVIAWGAPPNPHSLHVELCDTQKGSRLRWLGKAHRQMLERAAALVAQLALAYDVPIDRIHVAELLAGKHGICGHVDVSNAWHQTSHTDPGAGFPWKRFMAMVVAAANPVAAKRPTLSLHGPKHPHWTKVAQRALGLPVTGLYDKRTRAKVKAFRKAHHIRPANHGVVGARVWAKFDDLGLIKKEQ